MSPTIASRFPDDYQEHAYTRAQNDRELLSSLDRLSRAEDIESLERFAKAYLGMYLDMDNSIPANDRIDVLANPELAKAIRQGFAASLSLKAYPDAAHIADTTETGQIPIGYIMLAAMSLYAGRPGYEIESLPDETIIAAVCFYYAYKTESDGQWINQVLLKRPAQVTQATHPFWQQLISSGTDHLPGLVSVINSDQRQAILHDVLIPVLKHWTTVRKKTLRLLLQNAFAYTDHHTLLELAKDKLKSMNTNEPAPYTLWLATGFLLEPERYAMQLAEYCGRSKEKIIPLLDYCCYVLSHDTEHMLELNAQHLCELLRIIAPKITPQEDRYGALCDNSRRVLYLFYLLAMSTDPAKKKAVGTLLKVRVMKLYKPILTCRLDSNDLSLDEYIDTLLAHNLIRRRIKRYD